MSTKDVWVPPATTPQETFGRGKPLAFLVVALAALAVHHAWAMAQGTVYPSLVWVFMAVVALSIAGLVHPPVFFTIMRSGRPLPRRLKIIAAVIALAGAACGVVLAEMVYHPQLVK